jgi:hypothetical protein
MGIPIVLLIDKILGFIVDPLVYYFFGYYPTMIIGTIISIIVGYIYIRAYDRHQQDWLLFEKLKSTQPLSDDEKGKITNFLKNSSKEMLRFMLFIYFFVTNPSTALLLARDGSYLYDGFPTVKMKMIFTVSAIATNVVWTNAIAGINLGWQAIFK